jgi:hypothetical protein
MEIWQVIELHPNYEISTYGCVRNIKTQKILAGSLTQKGRYKRVTIGYMKQYRVHRLVALAFIPNPNNYPDVHHKDKNTSHNHKDNLEWILNPDNNKTENKNKIKPSIPFTKAQVLFMLENKGIRSAFNLAKEIGCLPDAVSKVWRGQGKRNQMWRKEYLDENPFNKHLFVRNIE